MILKKFFIYGIAILILFFFAYQSQNFKLDASSDTLILQNDKDFKFFNFYNEIFPNKNFLILAIKSDDQINQLYIEKIKKIKKKLSQIENIESIFSIVDAPILFSNNAKLENLRDNLETIQNTNIDLNIILNEFSNSILFSDQIISKDKKISSIIIYLKKNNEFENIKKIRKNYLENKINKSLNYRELEDQYMKLKEKNNKIRKELIQKIRDIINIENEEDKKNNISYKYFLGGIDMIVDDTISFVKKDILVFAITVFLFIFIVLFVIFKSLKWVLIPIISTSYAIILMIGLISFLNWEVTAISSNFISLMLILSISMNIHIINNYRLNYESDLKNNIDSSIKKIFWPCFYTAVTTIVAFSSLLISDIKPVIDFGKIMIVGLIIIFICSFTILPILISAFPKINPNKTLKFSILELFLKFSIKHNIKIYFANIFIFVISLIGIYNLNVENSFVNYFKKNTDIHQGMTLIDQNLGGTTPLDIIVTFNDNDYKNDTINTKDDEIEIIEDLSLDEGMFAEINENIWFTNEKVNTIKSIHNYLDSKNEIGKVQSLYSLIKTAEQINKSELDSFELSILYNEIPEEYKNQLIKPFLSVDKNMMKFSTRVKDSNNINRNQLINNINNELKSKYEIIKEVRVNGLLVLYNNMLQSLFNSQIKSFGLVLIAIFIMFLILFRSISLSIIGIIPNIFACSFILGFMGIAKIPLDIMTITVAAITIGIAVDNTIHYLYKMKNNINNEMSIKESLENSHMTVGQAVLTTSLTIAFGFSVLCLSNFIPTILFGLFTAIAMIIAMLGVLITLPSGIIKIKI